MKTNFFLTCLSASAAIGTMHAATVITPTGAVASTTGTSGRTIDKTIDGSDLTATGDVSTWTHAVVSGADNYFFTDYGSGNQALDLQLDFDLNGAGNTATFDVDRMHLWNYAPGNLAVNRGLGTVDIYYSTDNGTSYSTVPLTVSFVAGAGNGAVATTQTETFTAISGVTDIRLVADNLYPTDPYDGGSRYISFMEVRFGYDPIPEPSAALLGGLGVMALLRRRRS